MGASTASQAQRSPADGGSRPPFNPLSTRPRLVVTSPDRAAELFRRFSPLVYARCKRLLKDPAAAEDATQEVFLRAHRHIAAAPDDRAALKWLYRIGTNYCLNVIRDRARRPLDSAAELPEVPTADLAAVLEDRELALKLVMHAPEKLRAPALLHWVDGIDQGRVAEILDVTRRTVINRLSAFSEWARDFAAGREAP